MQALFEMIDLGQLEYYMGIKVRQHDANIDLCQAGYVVKILHKGVWRAATRAMFPWSRALS